MEKTPDYNKGFYDGYMEGKKEASRMVSYIPSNIPPQAVEVKSGTSLHGSHGNINCDKCDGLIARTKEMSWWGGKLCTCGSW